MTVLMAHLSLMLAFGAEADITAGYRARRKPDPIRPGPAYLFGSVRRGIDNPPTLLNNS
jgi:hypothetical protein